MNPTSTNMMRRKSAAWLDESLQSHCQKEGVSEAEAACSRWIRFTAFSIHLATRISTPTAKVSQRQAENTAPFTGRRNRNIQKNRNLLSAAAKCGMRASASGELY